VDSIDDKRFWQYLALFMATSALVLTTAFYLNDKDRDRYQVYKDSDTYDSILLDKKTGETLVLVDSEKLGKSGWVRIPTLPSKGEK
jgi:hypothetical protein